MRILHTESSSGWGGQEIRILREALGMRARGHEVVMAVEPGGGLVEKARAEGFTVYEVSYKKKHGLKSVFALLGIMRRHEIDLVNTHSSLDAWIGGIAARMGKKKLVRTRHLSAAIRKGLNSRLLYNTLADFVVTTSSAIIPMICKQSRRSAETCRCIPTGVDPAPLEVDEGEVMKFREQLGVKKGDLLVGTACFVRSWKGIYDFLRAAHELREEKGLKWVIIGGGHVKDYQLAAKEMELDGFVTFTGHLEKPYAAVAALDIFALLSTANEGISQSSLQAAYLKRPLITTPVGGLPEVCIDEKTGLIVPPHAAERFAEAVLILKNDERLREKLGREAHRLVVERFTQEHMLDQMEEVYGKL